MPDTYFLVSLDDIYPHDVQNENCPCGPTVTPITHPQDEDRIVGWLCAHRDMNVVEE